ncbi:hypothetical protein HGP14_19600 [Rhizobium sp. P32RR-XVIII]|uniref:hypothetical protein n=1 Tax=Rhizobium sp. P32RR-XVIII TaxID=2726738 RepID=UPI00145654D5|nr:hypothetical protein [Rhizobium sp. P32RR-XVIII]NLS05556.1 hypothetical protein [Rhizobium sp. P32RR-XVIII]
MNIDSEFHYTPDRFAPKLASWRKTMTLTMKILNVLVRFQSVLADARLREPAARPQAAAALSSHIKKDIGIDEGRTSSAEG